MNRIVLYLAIVLGITIVMPLSAQVLDDDFPVEENVIAVEAQDNEHEELFNEMFSDHVEELPSNSNQSNPIDEIAKKLGYNYSGNFINDAVFLIKEVAPSSKVVVMGLKEDYEIKGKAFAENLKKNGIKPISMLLSENSLNVSVLSKMFSVSEDVRAVVCLDSKLLSCAFYFAHYRNIEVVCGAQDNEFFKNFYFKFLIKNGKNFDYAYAPAKTHVILDEKLLESVDKAQNYAFCMSKLPCVFDYELVKHIKSDGTQTQADLKNETISAFFNLFATSIKSAYSIFNLNKEEQASHLLLYALSILLANAMTGGEFIDVSAPRGVELLLKKEAFNGHALVYATNVMLNLYGIVLGAKYKNVLEEPDYILRAEALSQHFGSDDKKFLEGLKHQIELLDNFGNLDFSNIEKVFTIDEKTIFDAGDNLINTYHVLGGNEVLDKQAVVWALNMAGDMPEFLNLISVCREQGLLELMMKNID